MNERKLATNTIFYSVALATQKLLSFGFFILLARSFGVAGQGRFSFALSFTSLFAIFLDLGLTQILIRETARDKDKAQKILSNIIGFKLAGSVILYGLVFIAINLMGYPEATKNLVYVSGLIMLVDSFTLTVYGAIRGRQNLSFESIGTIGNQFIVLLIGGALLLSGADPVLVMAAYLVASLSNLIYSAANLRRKYAVKLNAAFDWQMIKPLLIVSFPFALAGIFSRIFSAGDVVLLSKLSGDHAVGIYSAAFKVAFALQFVALAFSAAIYPAFSSYFAHEKDKLGRLFEKSIFWLMIVAGPMVFGVIAVADYAITPIFGSAYAPSIVPLKILMLSMLFVFLSFPVGAMLNACDRQMRHTVNLGITAAVSIILNLILIPLWGPSGSAVANLVSYIILFGLGISVVSQITKYDMKHLIFSSLKIFAACCIMYVGVVFVETRSSFVYGIIAGVILYALAAVALGLFSFKSLKEFLKSIKKKPGVAPIE